jgi:hypothetical protein
VFDVCKRYISFLCLSCFLLFLFFELRIGKEAHDTSNDDYMSKGSAYTGTFSWQGFVSVCYSKGILKTIIPNRVPALLSVVVPSGVCSLLLL